MAVRFLSTVGVVKWYFVCMKMQHNPFINSTVATYTWTGEGGTLEVDVSNNGNNLRGGGGVKKPWH
jgi:hypothetical protein